METLREDEIRVVSGAEDASAYYDAGHAIADGYQWAVEQVTDFLCWASGNC